jgi:hypothetical protein
VHHAAFLTTGLGLDAWACEDCVATSAPVHFASQRNQGMYGYTAAR